MESVIELSSGFLLDTHVLLWWLFDDPILSSHARSIIQAPENTILVSSASSWEIATKSRLGKLPHAGDVAKDLPYLKNLLTIIHIFKVKVSEQKMVDQVKYKL